MDFSQVILEILTFTGSNILGRNVTLGEGEKEGPLKCKFTSGVLKSNIVIQMLNISNLKNHFKWKNHRLHMDETPICATVWAI